VEIQLEEIRAVKALCKPKSKTAAHMHKLERHLSKKWGFDNANDDDRFQEKNIARELKMVLRIAKRQHEALQELDPDDDDYLEHAEDILVEAQRLSLMDAQTRAVYHSVDFEFRLEAPEDEVPLIPYLCAWIVWFLFVVLSVYYLAFYGWKWSVFKTWYWLWHVGVLVVLYYSIVSLFSVVFFKAYIPHSLKETLLKLDPTKLKSFPFSLKTPNVGTFLLEQAPELTKTRTGRTMLGHPSLPLARASNQQRSHLVAIQEALAHNKQKWSAMRTALSEQHERVRYVQAELYEIADDETWQPRRVSRWSLTTIYYFTRLPVWLQWLVMEEFISLCMPVVHYCLGIPSTAGTRWASTSSSASRSPSS
jgi:hypothetical protein